MEDEEVCTEADKVVMVVMEDDVATAMWWTNRECLTKKRKREKKKEKKKGKTFMTSKIKKIVPIPGSRLLIDTNTHQSAYYIICTVW